jgi:PleD family two-component response regulator
VEQFSRWLLDFGLSVRTDRRLLAVRQLFESVYSPLRQRENSKNRNRSMPEDSAKVPNVLIVEDEMMLRMRAVDIVEDAGFCPVEAVNADEALSILESRSDISLLFTDIQMPGSMDGLKLAHAVHDR